ncbi:MAG: aminotransferase class V-fold PLP-dependent enzyme [Acidobacteria bacterium]|jgi:selenocysteine lyase/cysteine desulfurase|nr:aminotransferase class V-fold PLP-dependent enzyme [Acidobacteriota bacterium]
MGGQTRRSFATRAAATLSGAALLTAAGLETTLAETKDLLTSSSAGDIGTDYWRLVRRQFRLDPGLVYLNNASLGPSPALVADATETFRRTLDGFPSRYMWGGWSDEKETVREKAAGLLGASPEEIALIHNTTEGMNLVASSLDLEPGDEIILADHEHPSGTIPWQYWQEPQGVKLVRPTLPILPDDPEEIVEVYRRSITPRTRVISMCHVVNTNGMILPVKRVSAMARRHGILVAVDGAQAPGMINVDLHDLGCDFYAASAHKWLFSPKGVGVFFARKAKQQLLKPLIVARGWEDESIRRLENYNTRNLPEVLGLGVAFDFQNLVGPDRSQAQILALKKFFRRAIRDDPAFNIKTPSLDELSAGITTVEVVNREVVEVAKLLAERHRIDCRPMMSHGLNGLRISLSIFNSEDEIDFLVKALRRI